MSEEKPKTKTETKPEKERPVAISKYAGQGIRINVGMMKLNAGDCVAFAFDGTRRLQKIGKGDKDATLFRGTNMDSGEVVDLIAPQVLLSIIEREFADDVKGRKLLLECSQRETKKYMDVFVSELT
ncbi:MAG: hypothetical protein A2W25_01425 [candidate division Zixibacteria bacterium RBG_16_53_22]|nr:MAG: hypothetical protein A2W25_01425 [candidate division Zixibacteria bacterium RBG_16_53_22]